jgi:hypothetical protein
MNNSLNFRIGAIGISLTGNPSWDYTRKGVFAKFSTTELHHTQYKINVNPPPIQPLSRPLFDTGNGWRLYQNNRQWLLWIPSWTNIPYLAGIFEPDYQSGEIFVSESNQEPGKYVFPLSFPMGELLMTNLLGTRYGIMLHSCGVIDEGEGIIFAGISGAGKTTTARLWQNFTGVQIVNDDHTIIRKIDNEFRLYGTPWHGQGGFAQAEDAPLKEIYILKHSLSNHAVRLAPPKAAAALLVRTFAPLWNAKAMALTLQFLDELCQAVPCYELGFVPDQSAVEYVRCLSPD